MIPPTFAHRDGRVVRPKRGLVSWIVMRLPVSLSALAAVAALILSFPPSSLAQAQSQSGSAPPQSPVNGTYISTDPLANIHYDNRYDLSLGVAYDHLKAGQTLLQGSNLGGLDLSGSYWLPNAGLLKARDGAISAPAAPHRIPTLLTGHSSASICSSPDLNGLDRTISTAH